ncbi:hypothetical protein PFLmoz3_02645 [Pseudomonas fluorescens]|uniref:Uncharacterized protein n=1 Tax=Pseudomonas fluorescens TaxID=294 RepID=A0A109LHK3_PSEFL|nr:hypothetical protein PFLmoz3_02645 [Pseudomonas fluorescens]
MAVLVGIHELLANAQRLHFALGLDARLGGFVEHLHAGCLDLLRALRHAIQRQTHQQGHDPQQAEARQQGDFPLNGELPERHRDILT